MNTLLRLCIRDQRAYNDLRSSGMIGPIPCPKTLSNYKNRVKQKSGINHDFLLWMSDEADALAVPRDARIGGLIVDEMSIQVKYNVLSIAHSNYVAGYQLPEEFLFNPLIGLSLFRNIDTPTRLQCSSRQSP